jgi:hypothetical protein
LARADPIAIAAGGRISLIQIARNLGTTSSGLVAT